MLVAEHDLWDHDLRKEITILVKPFLFSIIVFTIRSSRLEVFLRKGVLKICSEFTGEHPCRNKISIKLLCNFIEIAFWHWCSSVNLLHIFRTPFSMNTSGWLLLYHDEDNLQVKSGKTMIKESHRGITWSCFCVRYWLSLLIIFSLCSATTLGMRL